MSRPLWLAWMLLEEICFRGILNDMQLLVVWQSLATRVRTQMNAARTKGEPVQGFNYSTTTLLNRYLKGKTQLLYPEPHDVFPSDIIPGTDNIVPTEKVEQQKVRGPLLK